MDIRKIKKIVELFTSSNLQELEVNSGEDSIRIVKNHEQKRLPATPNQETSKQSVTESTEFNQAKERKPQHGYELKSPMVGTFYTSPSPEAKPFVQVGSIVNKGDTICIVEAMKMMNRIETDVSGTISQILIENGNPIEFDQTIVIIE